MNSIKYDSYYKFTVSLGITMCLLPFIGLYGLFLLEEKLLFSKEEYAVLTDASKIIIDNNLSLLHWLISIMPIIFFCCFILGGILIINGCTGWKDIQEELDKKVRLENDKLNSEIRAATPSEIYAKSAEEVDISSTKNENSQKTDVLTLMRLHEKAETYLENMYQDRYHMKRNYFIGKKQYDLLAFPTTPESYTTFWEIKCVDTKKYNLTLMAKYVHQLLQLKDNLEKKMNMPIIAELAIVFMGDLDQQVLNMSQKDFDSITKTSGTLHMQYKIISIDMLDNVSNFV